MFWQYTIFWSISIETSAEQTDILMIKKTKLKHLKVLQYLLQCRSDYKIFLNSWLSYYLYIFEFISSASLSMALFLNNSNFKHNQYRLINYLYQKKNRYMLIVHIKIYHLKFIYNSFSNWTKALLLYFSQRMLQETSKLENIAVFQLVFHRIL